MFSFVSIATELPCGRPAAAPRLRGWRNTVGSLIEMFRLKRKLSRASIYWHMREKQRGTVSSNSRFQTVLFQQCSANRSTVCSRVQFSGELRLSWVFRDVVFQDVGFRNTSLKSITHIGVLRTVPYFNVVLFQSRDNKSAIIS